MSRVSLRLEWVVGKWKEKVTTRDPRWRGSKWKLHKPPPGTKLELQQNYRENILNNQLNTSWREAL